MANTASISRGIADNIRPPGPVGLPVFGNMLDIRRDPLHFLMNAAQDYGDIVYYRLGTVAGYLLNHPEYVQHVLQMNHRNYNKDNYTYETLSLVVGNGLLTSDGDFWLRQRRLIQPAFHRKRIASFSEIMTDAAVDMLAQWDQVAARGEPIDVSKEMMRVTLRIVGEALFSTNTGSVAEAVDESFSYLNEALSNRFRTLLTPPLWVPTPGNRRFNDAKETLDRIVYDIIDERRQSGEQKDDLLDMLLTARDEETGERMTDEQLRDEVVTLLLAGHETTANALTWTWYLLSKHPDVARKLKAELDGVLGGRVPTLADLKDLTYTEMVIQESMRLYPPAWIFSRRAIEGDEIGGYPVPAGTVVSLCSYTMHRNPQVWDNPEGFDPERFSPERAESRHKFAYFPFGGGPRLCIGSNFAMLEAQLILATVAQRYMPQLVPGHSVEPEPLITLRPKYGMKMTLHDATE